ncbi:hypothetical protein [Mixta intestinalis]|nr:hypothetical protein [Mixta intestinalis]
MTPLLALSPKSMCRKFATNGLRRVAALSASRAILTMLIFLVKELNF